MKLILMLKVQVVDGCLTMCCLDASESVLVSRVVDMQRMQIILLKPGMNHNTT